MVIECIARRGWFADTWLVGLLRRDGSLAELNDMLAAQIGNGEMALDDPALRQHIRRSLEEALNINNPKWLKR